MGFLITGSDTRTPAHYHAVITAVSVSSAGMLLTFGLEELGRQPVSALATRALIALYGGGQFVASIGMFVAGGYGAARKTPTGVGSLDAVAAAGMAVHGIASIFTILGGAAFVIIAIRALARPAKVRRDFARPRLSAGPQTPRAGRRLRFSSPPASSRWPGSRDAHRRRPPRWSSFTAWSRRSSVPSSMRPATRSRSTLFAARS